MQSHEIVRLTLPAHMKYGPVLGNALAVLLDAVTPEAYNIQLAVHEAFANIVEHGYGGDGCEAQVDLSLMLDAAGRRFTAVLDDAATPFSPARVAWQNGEQYWETAVSAPATTYTLLNAPEPELLQPRGRGLFLMKQLMSSVACQVTATGNRWVLTKTW